MKRAHRFATIGAFVWCACAFASAAFAQAYAIAPELWDRPRTASAVMANASVKQAVSALLERADAQLVIHHAPAQEPLLQAEELRSWLAALAIDPKRVALRNDLAAGAPVSLEVAP